MKQKRNKKKWIIGLLCFILFFLSPLFPFVKSLAVMGVYSNMNQSKSLLEEAGVSLHIPGGLSTPAADWYPFVMTFSADQSYSSYVNEPDAQLTILYNFPSFSYTKGCSRLFDESSNLYNSFYGAYLVRDEGNKKLASGALDVDKMTAIAKFDFFNLVLGDFGLGEDDEVFSFQITETKKNLDYVGYDGWVQIHAKIMVNGAAHNKRPDVLSYLQYGSPNFNKVAEEFVPIPMDALIYGRYFPEADVGVYFYVMGTSEEICRVCDIDILSKSTLKFG